METSIAINITDKGTSFTVTTRNGAAGLRDTISGGGHYPKLGILTIKCPTLKFDK